MIQTTSIVFSIHQILIGLRAPQDRGPKILVQLNQIKRKPGKTDPPGSPFLGLGDTSGTQKEGKGS